MSDDRTALPLPQPLPARGLAVGVFDLFHVGHLRYLQYIRARCQSMVAVVARDDIVLAKKGHAAAVPEAQRMEMLRGLGWIDEVLPMWASLDDPDSTEACLRALRIDHVFIGDDWRGSARWQRLAPRLAAMGIGLTWTPRSEEVSTSALRARILNDLKD